MQKLIHSRKETMNRTDLELVVAICRHGSLVEAGRALRLASPAVSKRLAALEAHLGVRLFQRSTRKVSPTAEGEALRDRAAALLQGFAAAESEMRERQAVPSGPVRLAATLGFGRRWLGPLLAEFQQAHPATTVDLRLTENLPDLAREGFDGAIWLWQVPVHRSGEWTARRLAGNQRVLAAAPGYLQRCGTPRTVAELGAHNCLVVRENRHAFHATPDAAFNLWQLQTSGDTPSQVVAVKGTLTSNSGEMVRDWCLSGHGIMLRSLWDIAPQLHSGELVRVLPDWSMPDADVHWLAPYRPQVPRRIRLLVDFLAGRLSAEPWRGISATPEPPGSHQTP
jgi:DNA-binding transcriptional LysR family regulator